MEKSADGQFDKLSDKRISNIRIAEIRVGQRIRDSLGNLDALQDSMQRHGLLQPIILDKKLNLIAGQRRLEAAKNLGWRYINAVTIQSQSELEKIEIELAENYQRKNFTTTELDKAEKKIQELQKKPIWKFLIHWWKSLRQWLRRLFRF